MAAGSTFLERVADPRDWAPETRADELQGLLFSSLPRSDQRRKGEQYLRGLLEAEGRKSIRNIAACVGEGAADQSLHHFIASSTWRWEPMRRALCQYVDRALGTEAWVVRPTVIPKAGNHSIGVERRFVPWLGQVVNSQQAYGTWAVGENRAIPVDWCLELSGHPWRAETHTELPDAARRPEPPRAPQVSPLGCAAETLLLPAPGRPGAPGAPRPVVLDLPETDLTDAVRAFGAARVPVVARTRGLTRVRAADPSVPGLGNREFAARQLLHMVRTLRRPVEWTDPTNGARRTSQVAAVRVELPNLGGAPLLLIGEWDDAPRGWPRHCWTAYPNGLTPGALIRLTKLSSCVDRDFAEVSVRVGLMDFEGRSFAGWHRHMTLASAAHAVRVLSADWSVPAFPLSH